MEIKAVGGMAIIEYYTEIIFLQRMFIKGSFIPPARVLVLSERQ
jgi:hypothetical protein